jgi:hypothetical protein
MMQHSTMWFVGVSHLLFLPAMPPNTVRGMVTRPQMMRMTTMVPKGRAAVDCRQAGDVA